MVCILSSVRRSYRLSLAPACSSTHIPKPLLLSSLKKARTTQGSLKQICRTSALDFLRAENFRTTFSEQLPWGGWKGILERRTNLSPICNVGRIF